MSQNKFKTASEEALHQAIRANPENPLVYVLTGTALFGEVAREKNIADILAGRVCYNKHKRDSKPPVLSEA